MKPNQNKGGAVDPVTLTVITVLAVGVLLFKPSSGTPGKEHFWQFWKKNPVEQVAKADAAVDKAKTEAAKKENDTDVKITAEKFKQLDVAHEGAISTKAAVDAAIATTNKGELPKKELETASKTASLTVDAMDEALGHKATKRINELETMVSDLNAGVRAGSKALELMQTTLDSSVQRESALKADLEKIKAEGLAKVKLAEDERDAAVKKENKWALERDAIASKYENIKFWIFVGVGGLAFVWFCATFMPLISRILPSLEPLSKTVGSLWAPGVQLAHNAEEKIATDLVAATEFLKAKLDAELTPERSAAIRAELEKDWITAHDGVSKKYEAIKSKLRL